MRLQSVFVIDVMLVSKVYNVFSCSPLTRYPGEIRAILSMLSMTSHLV